MRPLRNIGILPSLLTLGNGFCGFLAIAKLGDAMLYTHFGTATVSAAQMLVFQQKVVSAAWLILLGMVFDALDGSVARFSGSTSGFGAQLDSLCDAVTFGVAPAFLTKVMIEHHVLLSTASRPHPRLYLLVGALFALCAILRLARFNAEHERIEEAHRWFRGLPTPAAAGVVASTVLLAYGLSTSSLAQLFPSLATANLVGPAAVYLGVVAPLLGLLMISNVRFRHGAQFLRRRRTFPSLVLWLLVVAIVLLEPELALACVFLFYVAQGVVGAAARRLRGQPDEEDDDDAIDGVGDEEAPAIRGPVRKVAEEA